MAFVAQNAGGKFVAWGKKNAKENSFIVEAGQALTGKVLNIKNSKTYGKIIELKTKDDPDTLIITGTTILLRELGYNKTKDGVVESKSVKPVRKDDVIRITFKGMLKTEKGKDAYNFMVEVDRQVASLISLGLIDMKKYLVKLRTITVKANSKYDAKLRFIAFLNNNVFAVSFDGYIDSITEVKEDNDD